MKAAPRTAILNGRLIDPANAIDETTDIYVAEGRILAIGERPPGFEAEFFIDALDKIVCPGLVDLNTHLREPGQEHKATIASETAAAAKAGITTLCCAPDTDPVIDTPAVIELIRRRAKQSGKAMVLPIGALTQGLGGEIISEMAALKEAGCVAVSNVHRPLKNTLVERRALEYAATYGLLVFLRPEDQHLRDNGCVHEGPVATRLGLPGIPSAAECVAVARDLALAAQTGARIHFRGISAATSLRMIRRAQGDGLQVSADVPAHQLHLTELDVDQFNSQCHVMPPLRTLQDRQALREGVAAGVISAICSDHQPHEPDAKLVPFPSTAPGISALETLLPLTLKLVEDGVLSLSDALARVTAGPAAILGIAAGRLGVGNSADICIFDPERDWTFTEDSMISAGHNSPFLGWRFTGQVTHTLFEGRIVYRHS
ncbi:MAG: dihydroorotase [Gammaproteobacteria bacterium]|nr:dihydroorotase [Gammaproteobacteria bacterium]MBU1654859.1 dihydroorotase [Gammaproteobacteria bacterium]MBU1961150.1 dihydroorotase [Gammaproteobacteria bacterium]